MSLQYALRSAGFMAVRSCPSKTILPDVGFSRFTSILPTVVLPQPDSPTRPNASPRRIWKLTSSTACTCEVALPKKFVSAAKRFVRCWTSSRIS